MTSLVVSAKVDNQASTSTPDVSMSHELVGSIIICWEDGVGFSGVNGVTTLASIIERVSKGLQLGRVPTRLYTFTGKIRKDISKQKCRYDNLSRLISDFPNEVKNIPFGTNGMQEKGLRTTC